MKYLIRQKIFSFGDNFVVKNELGEPVLKVAGKVFTLGDKLTILNLHDEPIYRIKQKLLKLLPSYEIYKGDFLYASLKKKFTLFSHNIVVSSEFGNYTVSGNVFGYSFSISKGNQLVASVSKKLFKFSDTYELEVFAEDNHEFIITLAIVIDQIIHDGKK